MNNWNNNSFIKWGITLILFIFGSYCMLKSYGYCDFHIPHTEEYIFQHYESRSSWEAKPGRSAPPTYNQRQQWQEAYDNHHFHAVRTYNDAYERIWFLPDINMRQLGRDAWIASCAMAGGSTVTARLVIAFTTMLSNYGLHCLDEWDYINEKLYWSQFHFEQCAYYSGLIHG